LAQWLVQTVRGEGIVCGKQAKISKRGRQMLDPLFRKNPAARADVEGLCGTVQVQFTDFENLNSEGANRHCSRHPIFVRKRRFALGTGKIEALIQN
jgi:hypothetical protein